MQDDTFVEMMNRFTLPKTDYNVMAILLLRSHRGSLPIVLHIIDHDARGAVRRKGHIGGLSIEVETLSLLRMGDTMKSERGLVSRWSAAPFELGPFEDLYYRNI